MHPDIAARAQVAQVEEASRLLDEKLQWRDATLRDTLLPNFLSHDNPGRLEVTFDQAKDFVRGGRDLTKRCEDHKLIKGR